MRRGFTLIEGLVVAALIGVAGTMFWQLFSTGMRREQKLDFRTRALQTAALTRARIAQDFASILPSASATPAKATSKDGVSFDRIPEDKVQEAGLPLDANLNPLVEKVTFRFDRVAHRLLRNGQLVAVGLIRDMEFAFESGADRGYTLTVTVVLCPEEEIASARPSIETRFSFSFHSPQGTLALAHKQWVGDRGL